MIRNGYYMINKNLIYIPILGSDEYAQLISKKNESIEELIKRYKINSIYKKYIEYDIHVYEIIDANGVELYLITESDIEFIDINSLHYESICLYKNLFNLIIFEREFGLENIEE